jgi:hypothetical protein
VAKIILENKGLNRDLQDYRITMISRYTGSGIFSIYLWVSLQLFLSSAFGIWWDLVPGQLSFSKLVEFDQFKLWIIQ